MANMEAVASSLTDHIIRLAGIEVDLAAIAAEFDTSEPFLEGEGDNVREVHGAVRLAARRLRELAQQYHHHAEARGLAGHDVLGSPEVIEPRSPARPPE